MKRKTVPARVPDGVSLPLNAMGMSMFYLYLMNITYEDILWISTSRL
ncbi:hypothetical protein Mpsy_1447 [Methanolobus psychrophilus R15]|nr:hypothetical protein Mpsy_1447 [Methanolobus psychrophilus R15]